jgi:peptidoglycan/xylan/chitin deacetylase (PgdA/CDA1 family)
VLGLSLMAAACRSEPWVTRSATTTSSTTAVIAASPPAPTATDAPTTAPTAAPRAEPAAPVAAAEPPATAPASEPSSVPPPNLSPALSAGGVGTWPAKGQVALTFDDGPGDATPAVLDILEHYQVPATFFVVGRSIGHHRDLLARMHADGDTVENHTWDHPHLPALSPSRIRAELARTSAAITVAIGAAPVCFRPPYLDTNGAVVSAAAAVNLHQVLANVNPADYERPDPAVITERILSAANGRPLVVGLHDGGTDRTRTVAALPAVIEGLAAAGYRFVNLCAAT